MAKKLGLVLTGLAVVFVGLLSGCVLAMFLDWLERREANPEGAEALRRLRCALTGKT